MTQYVVTVHANLTPRDGSAICAGFTFEVMRGDEDECRIVADRITSAYSDRHYLGNAIAAVLTDKEWREFIDRHQ